ncbi:MAG TPA: metallophosphoesterase family protein [Pirellulales bacterium]|jgi:hypothetical protein|nr:metallophosphoesterase family protein [Pirellulales bacterium]
MTIRMLDRRRFLGASLGTAAALAAGVPLLGKDKQDSSGSAPDTLFLTWQRDPTTTMTVQWIGPAHLPAPAINYTTAESNSGAKSVVTRHRPYPMSDLHVFRAELTGLTPGTEYQFQIGEQSSQHRFRTMPAKATDTFTFVSGGDCDVNSHAVANNIMAAKQDPHFVLIGGDLGYDDGKKVDKSLDFVRNYSQNMVDSQGRLIPLVVCIGNHEVNGGYGKTRREAPFFFALHDGLYAERSFATLDFGDYLSLVLLDTDHVAPIGGEQTAWLNQALAHRAAYPHLFAVNHVPAYPSHRAFDGDNGKEGTGEGNRRHWTPLIERYGVSAVFEHHDHTFKRTHPMLGGMPSKNGIVYLGDGSWGKIRAPQSPQERPYLAVSSEAYHLTVHHLEGDQCRHQALEEGGKQIDLYTTQKRPTRSPGRGRPT